MYCSDFYRDTLQRVAPRTNLVCMDATHGTTQYDFLLVTLMVKDHTGMGCPVAHCICTKENEDVLYAFLNEVRKKVDRIVVGYFMSDMAGAFYNAWCSVMHTSDDYPYPLPIAVKCIWHVIKAWKEMARRIIADADIELDIMNKLRALLHTRNASKVKQVIHN